MYSNRGVYTIYFLRVLHPVPYNGLIHYTSSVIISAAQLGFRAVPDARSGVSHPKTVLNFKTTR